MAYTTIDNSELYFQTKLYAGNGSSQSITLDGSENMQPDWVWIKSRTDTRKHNLYDAVRGTNKRLVSNETSAEDQPDSNAGVNAFNSDGFTVGSETDVNGSSRNFVAWNWKAGTSFSNDASATSVGTLDSSGSTSQTAGFSIVSFTGSGSANQSVAHNLGGTPEMIIFKCRETATDWTTFHTKLGGANKNLSLNSNSTVGTDTDFFANTNPTSTVFSVGAASNTNRGSEGMIAYCFRSIKGYSKFGIYTGNSSTDGTFIYMGFKPAFLMVKALTQANENWYIKDNKRDPFNEMNQSVLYANGNAAEDTGGAWLIGHACANGFKITKNDTSSNGSGQQYIYMAFAESPFVNSNGVPNNGRARPR